MQLFSRKKAILALSIGALSALGACGDDVTVASPPDAPVVVSITPPSATMNIGESLNFAVQITGGSSTTPPTLTACASSNASVATAAVSSGACRVTAVAAGNITVTATASTGGTAAASVSVTPATAAINNLTVSPTTANMTTGQKTTITPNVGKGAASVTVAYAYVSSSTAVATVAANGEITAVAPGTATITTTATGSGTGFTTTTLTAGTTVNVTGAPNPITSLTVQPSSLSMSVGSTSPILASVAQVSGSTPAVITFGTTNPAVATVLGVNPNTSGLGTVTAVGPGTAVITVTATTPANAQFAASTVTQLVPVTVQPSANVTIYAITQGPVSTVYYEDNLNSQNAASQNTAADISYVGEYGIYEYSNPNVNGPVDINSVRDQIQVIVNLQPNGQRVDSVVAFIAPADGSSPRRAAARQLYSNGVANAEQITLYINTADFTANFAAGTADVFYTNGQKIISVSVYTTDATGAKELGNASNNRQTVNFNNLDGYAGNNVNPTRVAQGDPSIPVKANLNWWGGPGTTGEGRSTIIPVFYTPLRTLRVMTVAVIEARNPFHTFLPYTVCNNQYEFAGVANPTPSPLPHTVIYGFAPTATASIGCDGYEHPEFNTGNFVGVVRAIDNYNNQAPNVTVQAGFRRSAAVTRPIANRLDYEGPNTTMPEIWRERPAVSGWVNAAFNFNTNTGASHDRNGVGVKNNSRTWSYWGCGSMTVLPMPTMTGADIPECATDFLGGWIGAPLYTRGPWMAHYLELDRLDNPSTSSDSYRFGVDKTVPLIRLTSGSATDTLRTTNAAALALAYQAEFIDERSGFVDNSDYGAPVKNPAAWTCAVTGCSFGYGIVDVNAFLTNVATFAQYPTDRSQFHFLSHGAGYLPAANYPTRSQCLVASPNIADVWRLTDPFASVTQFVNPAATFLSNPGCTLAPARNLQGPSLLGDGYVSGSPVAEPREGIYRYDTRVWDRAGNGSATVTRRNGIDLNAANFSSISASLGVPLGGAAAFQTIFEDNTEVRAASLKLQYNSTTGTTLATQIGNGANVSIAAIDTLMYSQQILDARFNDNINGPALANLALPMGAPTVTSIEFTNLAGQVVANNNGTKMSLVGGSIWDWGNRQDVQGGAGTPRNAQILGSGLADPIGFGVFTTNNPNLGFSAWAVLPTMDAGFNAGAGLKAQVTSGTNSINAPFARVDFYRRGTGNCTPSTAAAANNSTAYNCLQGMYYLGSSSSAVSADQGTTRFWTYLAPSTLAPTYWFAEQASAAVAAGQSIVAVGVRLTGEALATQATIINGSAINLTLVYTAPLTANNVAGSVAFSASGQTTITRTASGTFSAAPVTWTVTAGTVIVPVSLCATGLAGGTVTTALAPNPVVVGPAASTVTVTYACVP